MKIEKIKGASEVENSVSVSEELARVMLRACLLPGSDYRFDISFGTLVLGLLASDDDDSKWFQGYVNNTSIDVKTIRDSLKIDEAKFAAAAVEALSDPKGIVEIRPTSSILRVLQFAADNLALAPDNLTPLERGSSGTALLLSGPAVAQSPVTSGKRLSVRHVVGAIIYSGEHTSDLYKWGFYSENTKGQVNNDLKREAWSNAFLEYLTYEAPEDINFCLKYHESIFPGSVRFTTAGMSTHLATDLWTTDDRLEYRYYARAIAAFMTHDDTHTPLSISIQAPWGGGKTSLMRMVQQRIDPNGYKKSLLNQARSGLEIKENDEKRKVTIKQQLPLSEISRELENWSKQSQKPDLPEPVDLPPEPVAKDRWSILSKPLLQEWIALVKRFFKVSQSSEKEANTEKHRLTVWFNAWKYESTNQALAGLVETIMLEVAARFSSVAEREIFWLRLNLKRTDPEKIRRKLYERWLSYMARLFRERLAWIAKLVAIYFVLHLGAYHFKWAWANAMLEWMIGAIGNIGKIVGQKSTSPGEIINILLTGGGGILFLTIPLNAKQKVDSEPAAVSLSDLLDLPNYEKELGFLHHVESDLRRVLSCIPQKMQPIVIFIDDLDRCSPGKVAQVIEAVNLFLAGDFPKCMFVLGMDSELVAAALDVAHKDMIEHLPGDARTPIGWRFMDKFVQLSFTIPPIREEIVTKYANGLLISRRSTERKDDPVHPNDLLPTVNETEEIHEKRLNKRLDAGIKNFSDGDKEIIRLIKDAATYFNGNPREYKRFLNAFRFNYYLWWAARVQGQRNTTLDQLQRWTVLCLKWPEIVRWMRRGTPATQNMNRLHSLELTARRSVDLVTWKIRVTEELHVDQQATSWLHNEELRAFLAAEGARLSNTRLSAGVGKGIW